MFNLKSNSITKPITRLVPNVSESISGITQRSLTSTETLHIQSHGCGFAHQLTFSTWGGELIINLHITGGHKAVYGVSVILPDNIDIVFKSFSDRSLAMEMIYNRIPSEFHTDIELFLNQS